MDVGNTSPLRTAAIAQAVLEGVALPAGRRELVAYARMQDTPAAVLAALGRLPDREYERLDDVGEAIAPAQPTRAPRAAAPREESGRVPGGRAYTSTDEEPGRVRDSPEILPYEQQLVRGPAPVGEGIPEPGERDEKPTA